MKKNINILVSLIVCISICLSSFGLYAFAEEDTNETLISFVLGESEIEICGEKGSYEKPYADVSGVVLVPFVVLEKAFGVSLIADDTLGSYIVSHPEVSCLLQEGNILVDVNGIPEILPVAPVSENGNLMVPLRFFAENYGAIVTYDAETSLVTVKKSLTDMSGSIIEGGIDTPRIGDSNFNWSIENTSDMIVGSRDDDGTYTCLESEEFEKTIEIYVDKIKDNYDFERDFYNRRYSVTQNSLIHAHKDDSNPQKRTMRIKEKGRRNYEDTYIVVTDKNYFEIIAYCSSENKDDCESVSRIVSSFDNTFNKEDTHDLHKVKSADSYELFESEEFNLSLELPSIFEADNISSYNNTLIFASDDDDNETSSITVSIYSKEEGFGAKELAERNYKFSSMYYNEKISTVADSVKEAEYANFSGYEYDFEYDGQYMKDYVRKVYFEVGDYIYYLCIGLALPNDKARQQVDYVCNSLKPEPVDEDFEKIIYNIPEITETTYICRGEGWEFEVPGGYVEYVEDDVVELTLNNGFVNIMADFSNTTIRNMSELKALFEEYKSFNEHYGEFKILQPLRKRMIGKNQYFELAFSNRYSENSDVECVHLIGTCRNGRAVMFGLYASEHMFSQNAVEDMYEMAKSLEFTKK